jgi:ankyrin repeat protein
MFMKRSMMVILVLLLCLLSFCQAARLEKGLLAANDGESMLMDAVNSGNLAKVKALIEKNPSLAKNYVGMLRAVIMNYLEIAQYLVSKGADANACEENGDSLLMTSCQMGDSHLGMTLFLISKGASVNRKDRDGDSLLVYAIRGAFQSVEAGETSHPPFETVKLVLSKGVPAQSVGSGGFTPLMCEILGGRGCFGCNPAIVKLLLSKGADVKTRDKEGMTALAHAQKVKARVSSDKARSRDVDECITLLKKSGAK